MEQNNNTIVEQKDCTKLIETMYAKNTDNQQTIAEFDLHDLKVQQIDSQLPQSVTHTQCVITSANIEIKPFINQVENNIEIKPLINQVENSMTEPQTSNVTKSQVDSEVKSSIELISNLPTSKISINQEKESTKYSQIQTKLDDTPKQNVTVLTQNYNPHTKSTDRLKSMSDLKNYSHKQENNINIYDEAGSSSGFRVAEFVLKNLDSAPGEEKFYSWSIMTKNFAKLSNSNDQSTSIITDNEQLQTKWSRDKTSKERSYINSDSTKLPKSKRIGKEKTSKYARWVAERDRILKKYSQNLMRKKPISWQPQERSNIDGDLSSDI